ncbi:hypothetical protein GCM10023144_01560 [Pigmentiphaga soli]|uniref:Uncharacterized protein n=1 Tax=Pigmentiphaga soli TaxID=1007095 RepID=A0ABP8GCZ0_9BURK
MKLTAQRCINDPVYGYDIVAETEDGRRAPIAYVSASGCPADVEWTPEEVDEAVRLMTGQKIEVPVCA